MDLGTLLEHRASVAGDRPFLLFEGGITRTFADFNELVNRVAHGLSAASVVAGEPVAIMLPNCEEFLVASFALKKLGAIEIAVNTEFRGPGLAHALNMSRARLLITHSDLQGALADINGDLMHLRRLVWAAAPARAASSLAHVQSCDFAELVSGDPSNPARDVVDTDVATVLFTSGTTGPSKGCTLSHRYALRQAQLISDALELRDTDCLYCPFPLYHLDAAHLTVVPALWLGARAAIGRRFSVRRFWDEIRAFDATVFDFMGATLTMLWKQDPHSNDADNPARLAWGVPMPRFRREFERRFALKLVHCYGLTDGGMPTWESLSTSEPEGSCGKPRFPYQVQVVDEHDGVLPTDAVGEIVIRPLEPDVVMKGYWGMPEATLAAFRNLWLHTGDLGRIDAGGHLHFVGRQKDAIRRRGENISAWEVEQVIDSHPDVLESAAVGVPSDLTEETVKVFVVPREGSRLSSGDLLAHTASRLARFAQPELVVFVDALPKTPTGKVAKHQLTTGNPPIDRRRKS